MTSSVRLLQRAGLAIMLLCAAGNAQGDRFAVHSRLFPVGPNPASIAAADLNGDGRPEIVTADRGVMDDPREESPANDELSLLIAGEDLTYTKRHPSLKTDFAPYAVTIANIDAQKWPDIVVASFHAVHHKHINLFLNLRQEDIFKRLDFSVPEDGLPYLRHRDGDGAAIFTKPGLTAIAVRDINHDRIRDLVATAWSSDRLVFLPGDAETSFGTPRLFEAPGAPCDLALNDFDGDGESDLAVVMSATHELALFRGDGEGGFEEVVRIPTRGRLPSRVRVHDMNGDGRADIVVSHRYTEDSVVIFYGDGGFRFSLSQELLLGEDREVLEHEIRDLAVDDFDGDGRGDLAAACYASGQVVVLMNTSDNDAPRQSFRKERYRFDSGDPRAICVADVDGNGRPDLAVALWDADAVGLLLGKE